MVEYSIEKRGQEDYYRFTFTSKNFKADKIVVSKTSLHYFMFCFEKGYTFQQGSRTIEFDKQSSYTIMKINIANRDPMIYRLYDSEYKDFEKCVDDNNL